LECRVGLVAGLRWFVDQACGGSASGLPECSEISQSALDFTKIFTAYTG
jgi:hypothetical protein